MPVQELPVSASAPPRSKGLAWVKVAKNAPYFITGEDKDWTPVGQNDSIAWLDLQGLFLRRDFAGAEAYVRNLAAHGVTCMRLMLEYCHREHRYLERPAGRFQPNMIRLWDDLVALCEKYGIRLLLTPFDTFWMWLRWSKHPYNVKNGGRCHERGEWLLCREFRNLMKERLAFATKRWGGSGAVFAWDLWNEINPQHCKGSVSPFADFAEDVASFLRRTELRLHGRSHPISISVFQPILDEQVGVEETIFRHPQFDFASTHFYEHPSINSPKNTVDAANAVGGLVRRALREIRDNRPFFDSEHGPIHTFLDKRKTLPEAFDDEYFKHIQWAHLASGAAGGGMRWPNRHPHTLTPGMRAAQRALSGFLPLVNWSRFQRKNWNSEAACSHPSVSVFACGDDAQAVAWLLRKDTVQANGMLNPAVPELRCDLFLPMQAAGEYRVSVWDTQAGVLNSQFFLWKEGDGTFQIPLPGFRKDVAVAVRKVEISTGVKA